jgi:hypothetical protein
MATGCVKVKFLYLLRMPEGNHEYSYTTAGPHVLTRPWHAANKK